LQQPGAVRPERIIRAFWYRADSWPAQRWVIVKCEANAQRTKRRAIVRLTSVWPNPRHYRHVGEQLATAFATG
jgi:hypothetical protein